MNEQIGYTFNGVEALFEGDREEATLEDVGMEFINGVLSKARRREQHMG